MCPSSYVSNPAEDEYWTDKAIYPGLRTTLQFDEGRASHGLKTNWLMQDYGITKKCDRNTEEKIMENKTGHPLVILEQSSEMDCILRGDYFELNDLIDPGSQSSSSANSSCLTVTSDEYFDSMALLQELDKDIIDQEMKDSYVKFNLSAPLTSTEMFTHPTTSVTPINDRNSKRSLKEASIDCKSLNISKNAFIEGKKEHKEDED
ncbi:hypothetical protein E3N88_10472 [Mikania micrantha]|uniref:NAC domain-containing protein n=1 Tax=Mikania micrantha TaxID=192012 RepID=A0A5N6PAK4_9ASTR|nr:hypothetical protein E3N88_10472 [Mikania micrantha]